MALVALPARRVLSSRLPHVREVEEEVGRRAGPEARLVALTGDYGLSLQYHAWVPVAFWPNRLDQQYERLQGQAPVEAGERLERFLAPAGFRPTHFVVTRLDELKQMPDLAALLASRYEVCYQDRDCLVYDLRRAKAPG